MATVVPADLRALIEERQLQKVTTGPAVARTIGILATYAAGTALGLWASHLAVWLVVWSVQALILNGAISAAHEGLHGNLSPRGPVNRLLAELWSATVLLNFSLYRAFHLEHHRRTRLEGDPEPQVEFSRLAGYLVAAPFLGLLTMVQMWGLSLLALAGRFPPYVRTDRQRRAIRVDGVVVLVLTALAVAAAVADLRLFAVIWGIPVLLSSPVFTLTVLPEHYGLPRVPEPLAATRSTRSNAVLRFLYWENNLHAEHHLLPGVPYHRQHEVRDALGDRVVNTSDSYLRWHIGLMRDLRHPDVVIDLRDEPVASESVPQAPSGAVDVSPATEKA